MTGRTRTASGIAVLLCVFISIQAFAATAQYSYDSLNRLVKVERDDGTVIQYTYDAAGNRLTRSVAVPTPVVSSFAINNGALSTTSTGVTLNNDVTGSTPAQFMASESSSFTDATWQTYSTAPSFTLSSGFGAKTVYFKVKNSSGAESAVVNDTILLVEATPVVAFFVINNYDFLTVSTGVILNTTVTGSTPTQYMASESSSFTDAGWQTYSTAPSFTLSSGFGAKTVYFKVKNSSGTESAVVNDTISLVEDLVISPFAINNGAASTTSTDVVLNNWVWGSTPTQYMASESSSFTDAGWQTYSTTPSFTLSSGFGAKTVYFKVKNSSGAESAVVNDTISLVEATPVVSYLAINNDATSTTSTSVTLNNTVTGSIPTQYMASESSSFTGAGWQTYSAALPFSLISGYGVKIVYFKVKNSSGIESGAASDAIEYIQGTPNLSLPGANGAQGTTVQIPINLGQVSGLLAASFSVTYDSSVLTATGASFGTLTSGWTVAANTNTPGRLDITMSSTQAVSGPGQLVVLTFTVNGAPGSSTPLSFVNPYLNNAAIPVIPSNGSFTVDTVAYNISGTVRFWKSGVSLPGVQLAATGERLYGAASGADGAYSVSGLQAGSYALTTSKADQVNGITAYDASLVLQHAVGLTTLSGYQTIAADVNKSGGITAMDASYILQKAVDLITLPFPGSGAVWAFDPPSRTYDNLSSDQSTQDFTAILIGDVNGNWDPSYHASSNQAVGGSSKEKIYKQSHASLKGKGDLEVGKEVLRSKGNYSVPLKVKVKSGQLFSANIVLQYDSSAFEAVSVTSGRLAKECMIASNLHNLGKIRIALASSAPITGSGDLLSIAFKQKAGKVGQPHVLIRQAQGNDGQLKITIEQKSAAKAGAELLQEEDEER